LLSVTVSLSDETGGRVMEMQHVRYFVAVAETLNFTAAARQCNVTQPALTRAIQQLEHELGGLLVNRERGNTHLTELGRIMHPYLCSIWQQTTAAKQAALAIRRLERARLRIGAMCTIGPQLVSDLIVRFQSEHPDVEIAVVDDGATGMLERLEKGDLEIALVGIPSDLPPSMHQVPVFEERFVVVLPRNHRLVSRNPVRTADLHNEPYVSRTNCEVFKAVADDFASRGVVPRKVFSSPRDDWVQGMIKAGLGFGFFPEHSVTEPDLVVRPLVEPEYSRMIFLATMRGRPHSAAVGAFVKAARCYRWPSSVAEQARPARARQHVLTREQRGRRGGKAGGCGNLDQHLGDVRRAEAELQRCGDMRAQHELRVAQRGERGDRDEFARPRVERFAGVEIAKHVLDGQPGELGGDLGERVGHQARRLLGELDQPVDALAVARERVGCEFGHELLHNELRRPARWAGRRAAHRSLWTSADSSTASVRPLFFHQCEMPPASRDSSPALCTIGVAQVLRYSVTSPDTVMMRAGRSAWLWTGTTPPGFSTRRRRRRLRPSTLISGPRSTVPSTVSVTSLGIVAAPASGFAVSLPAGHWPAWAGAAAAATARPARSGAASRVKAILVIGWSSLLMKNWRPPRPGQGGRRGDPRAAAACLSIR
jgi:DNA-binding transcriptional LysR family regulator